MIDQFLKHLELQADSIGDAETYPFNIPAIKSLDRLQFHPHVTFLIGENGTGKSTLLESIAIMAGFNPEGGTKNFRGQNRPSESALHEHLRLARGVSRETSGFFLRAETMFNVATEAEAVGGWQASLHEMSHGESFMWVMNHRFGDRGLYLLDEPEAALSPQRQLACLARIHQLVASGSQFVIATHSPILMAYPEAKIMSLSEEGLEPIEYEDTEHYTVTKMFMDQPRRFVQRLLADD